MNETQLQNLTKKYATYSGISTEMGISTVKIKKHMKQLNLKLNPNGIKRRKFIKSKKERIEAVIQTIRKNRNLKIIDIAKQLGETIGFISNVKNEYNVLNPHEQYEKIASKLDGICGIYVMTNTTNNKEYIGSSCDIGQRIRGHISKLKTGLHKNKEMIRDWHNGDNFSFVLYKEYKLKSHIQEIEENTLIENWPRVLYNKTIKVKPKMSIQDYARFQTKFKSVGDCHIWHKVNKDGYGGFSIRGRTYPAHRVIYYHCNPNDPAGLIVRHLCHNKLCVNPKHLAIGSTKQNMDDEKNKTVRSGESPK